jgi:hypothetical protein
LFFRIASRVFDFLASLQLAVFIILVLAVVLAVGTVYESRYSAAVASQIVYRAWWMQILLWLFMMNLAAAALSRWPWKRHHIGFLITHLGIITLLLGSWVQQRAGVDGVLALAPNEKGRLVNLPQPMLYVFRAQPGKTYDLVLNQELNFDLRFPETNPVRFPLEGDSKAVTILRHYPKAARVVQAKEVESNQGGVPALKFRISGSRATFDDWMFLQPDVGTTQQVGPATLRFIQGKPDFKTTFKEPTLFFYLGGDNKGPLRLAVAKKEERLRDLGPVNIRQNMPLGWMDFDLFVESFFPSAVPRAEYTSLDRDVPGVSSYQVVEAELDGVKLWLELGASGQITSGDSLYYMQFTRRQVDLKFEVELNRFEVGYYEGTNRPKSYSSLVTVEGKQHLISMNEPLKHGGYTFYQASYEMDDVGQPRLSVLSVNYDPGRFTKYFGSLMLCLGIVSMFYFRPIYSGNNSWLLRRKRARESEEE